MKVIARNAQALHLIWKVRSKNHLDQLYVVGLGQWTLRSKKYPNIDETISGNGSVQ